MGSDSGGIGGQTVKISRKKFLEIFDTKPRTHLTRYQKRRLGVLMHCTECASTEHRFHECPAAQARQRANRLRLREIQVETVG